MKHFSLKYRFQSKWETKTFTLQFYEKHLAQWLRNMWEKKVETRVN